MNERSFICYAFMVTDKSNDKRTLIIEAAEKLIAESGFQGLSMQKVAKEAKVAAGTIYRYFEDKEHLLDEVRLHVVKRIASSVQAGLRDDMSLKERYCTMWMNIWTLASSSSTTLSSRVQYDSLPCAHNPENRQLEREMFSKINELFEQGKEQGIFKPLENPVLAGLSFETSVVLARKQSMGLYQLEGEALRAAMEASWDAIINH